ncbi:MAG: flagellar hook-associated protein FlgL [Rhodocyclales bacterium]|nr:flagellar hook-associated protein FlgL [Rhodocyclales bacterium]
MRISTGMIYDSGLRSMHDRMSSLLRTQQQLSTGRRILSPSDDPVAAARALEISQAQAVNGNQETARNNVKSTLGIIDGQLDSAENIMQRVRELTVQAGDAALADTDRASIATELRARFQEMVALANSRDGNGQYLFGGYQSNNQPFAGSVENGVRYGGDDGARTLRVSGSRELPISESGNSVFMNIMSGNGVFATGVQSAKSANATQMRFEGANSIVNPPPSTGNLELRFWVDTAGGVTTPGQGVGSVAVPLTYTSGTDNQLIVDIDGGAPLLVDLDPLAAPGGTTYADTQAVVDAVQAGIGGAGTVSLDINGHLVVTSATSGAASSVAFSGNAAAGLVGTPTYSAGLTSTAGQTFYDLVDANGDSVFTGAESTTGVGGSYTHLYASGTPLSLNNPGLPPGVPSDYGANLIFTGTPQTGDIFSVNRSASQLMVTAKTLTAAGARAVIDAGAVSDRVKWGQVANSGDLELRFWVDTAGVIATAGQTVGSQRIYPGITVGAGNQFDVTLDGAGPTTVAITAGSYATPDDLVTEVQGQLDAAFGANQVTATLDAADHLVLTSASTGANSAVALAENNGGLAALFGTPAATAGTPVSAGATYYDLVDATSGNSLFTGSPSLTGAGGSYTHAYASGTAISLASAGGPGRQAFDFGAAVTVTGIPAGGDAFKIQASDAYYGNGYFVTGAATTATVNAGSGVVGVGEVSDAAKWNHPANSRNLEVRFWKNPATVPPVLYYDLVDVETEKSLFSDSASTAGGTGNTYTHAFVDGDPIAFNNLNVPYAGPPATTVTDFGIRVDINGTPEDGDVFKVQASQSVSVFDSLGALINDLETGVPPGSSGNTELMNKVAAALGNIGQIEDNFLRVRAVIGTRLAEVDDLDTVGSNLDLKYSETLANLQDLDYAEAITEFTRQQSELQAAQMSYSQVAQLSLFNYLK